MNMMVVLIDKVLYANPGIPRIDFMDRAKRTIHNNNIKTMNPSNPHKGGGGVSKIWIFGMKNNVSL